MEAAFCARADDVEQFRFSLQVTGTGKLLKQHYGLSSEKLAEFHLRPFRGRNRRANPTPPPPSEDAAPAVPSEDPK